jgi:hypothetical protein
MLQKLALGFIPAPFFVHLNKQIVIPLAEAPKIKVLKKNKIRG